LRASIWDNLITEANIIKKKLPLGHKLPIPKVLKNAIPTQIIEWALMKKPIRITQKKIKAPGTKLLFKDAAAGGRVSYLTTIFGNGEQEIRRA